MFNEQKQSLYTCVLHFGTVEYMNGKEEVKIRMAVDSLALAKLNCIYRVEQKHLVKDKTPSPEISGTVYNPIRL